MRHMGRPIRSQIALEFMIVYAIVLVVFVVVFALIAGERSVSLSSQQASIMQLLSQNIASYINQALQAGSGYTIMVPLSAGIGVVSYTISISTSGLVIANTTVGKESITGITLSEARRLFINGTLTASGNGIQVYKVPTYTGSVSITNAGGIILIDEPALHVPSLVAPISLSQPATVVAPYFNGVNSLVSAPSGNNLVISNSLTLDAWVYLNSINTGSTKPYLDNPIIGESGSAQPFLLTITNSRAPAFLLNWGPSGTFIIGSSNIIATRTLYNIAATFNKSSSTETIYINGKEEAGASTSLTLSGSGNVIIGGSPQNQTYLNGYVINAQVYSASLSPSQISQIYSSGPSGVPSANLQNLAGWWPLNGNANDYSGYGSSATPYNLNYRYVVDTLAQLSTLGGVAARDVPIGFASVNDLIGGYNSLASNSSTGMQSTLLTSNGFSGSSFIQAVAFNGNSSTIPNLIGWWPLDLGNSNSIGEYSGRSIGGNFINSNYGYLFNRTNTLVGQFNGANSYISSTPFPTVANTFAVSVWLYPTALTQSSFGSSSGGSIIDENENGGGSGWNLGVKNNNKFWFWPGSGGDRYSTANIPLNTWTHVVVTYSQNTVDIYINGSLDSSQAAPSPQGGATFFKIGAESWIAGYWSGSMADLQVYNTTLSAAQAKQLYTRGLTSAPLPNQGLVGWWPMAGGPKSYANIQTQYSSAPSGMSYNSVSLSSQAVPAGSTLFPTFNGIAKVTFASTVLPNNNLCNITIAAWAYDSGMPAALGGVFNFSNTGKDDIEMNDSTIRFDVSNSVLNAWTFTPGYSFAGSWSFLATTLSNGIATGYLNGLPTGTPPSNGIGCINIDNAVFGAYAGNYMTGSIVDVQVYNSTLSLTQIQQLYLQGIPKVVQLNTSLG